MRQSLIGYFDLDPNRVFDVVLQAFEVNLKNSAYLRIIEVCLTRAQFKASSNSLSIQVFQQEFLPHIVGFKFQYYHRKKDIQTPQTLYRLSAELIKSGYLSLDLLMPHMWPPGESALVMLPTCTAATQT